MAALLRVLLRSRIKFMAGKKRIGGEMYTGNRDQLNTYYYESKSDSAASWI